MSAPPVPASMPPPFVPPPPPPGYVSPLQPAGFVERFIAALIDLVVLAIVAVVITLPLGLLTAFSILSNGGAVPGWVGLFWGPFSLVLFAVFVLYFTYFEGTSGQTLGKRLLRLKVVDLSTGRPPDLARSLLRNVIRIFDWLPFLYILGFVVALFTTRRQRIGDVAAGTIVTRL